MRPLDEALGRSAASSRTRCHRGRERAGAPLIDRSRGSANGAAPRSDKSKTSSSTPGTGAPEVSRLDQGLRCRWTPLHQMKIPAKRTFHVRLYKLLSFFLHEPGAQTDRAPSRTSSQTTGHRGLPIRVLPEDRTPGTVP